MFESTSSSVSDPASSSRQEERYPFFEYRFKHGSVPDVLVEEAVAATVFNSEGMFFKDESANPPEPRYQRINKLLKGFDIPSEFSDGSKRRWKEK